MDVITNEDGAVLKNLSQMGEQLKKFKQEMFEAEARYEQAKKNYEYYATSVLPMQMYTAGVTELKLASGGTMSYDRKFYCQPNKNEEDKRTMAEWLRKHGGEDLIKQRLATDPTHIAQLEKAGIPYVEIVDMNTQSLKAFLRDAIGAGKSGVAQVAIEDIPECMHFTEHNVVSIDL